MARNITSTDDKRGTNLELPCFSCDRNTSHTIITSIETEFRFDEGDEWYIEWDDYQLVRCQGCHNISFRIIHSDTEDMAEEYNPDIDNYYVPVKHESLYPPRIVGHPKMNDYYYLPATIKNIYEETHIAICNNQRILAGIGIRAIIESVCQESHATGNYLSTKINDLVLKGILTQRDADILHQLRVLGNDAAHQIFAHEKDVLLNAINIVESLLNVVYILPTKAQQLH